MWHGALYLPDTRLVRLPVLLHPLVIPQMPCTSWWAGLCTICFFAHWEVLTSLRKFDKWRLSSGPICRSKDKGQSCSRHMMRQAAKCAQTLECCAESSYLCTQGAKKPSATAEQLNPWHESWSSTWLVSIRSIKHRNTAYKRLKCCFTSKSMVDPDNSQSQSLLFTEAPWCLRYGEFCVQALYTSIHTTAFKSAVLLVMTVNIACAMH